MHPDLSDDETAALTRLLCKAIDEDRWQSPDGCDGPGAKLGICREKRAPAASNGALSFGAVLREVAATTRNCDVMPSFLRPKEEQASKSLQQKSPGISRRGSLEALGP